MCKTHLYAYDMRSFFEHSSLDWSIAPFQSIIKNAPPYWRVEVQNEDKEHETSNDASDPIKTIDQRKQWSFMRFIDNCLNSKKMSTGLGHSFDWQVMAPIYLNQSLDDSGLKGFYFNFIAAQNYFSKGLNSNPTYILKYTPQSLSITAIKKLMFNTLDLTTDQAERGIRDPKPVSSFIRTHIFKTEL